MNTKEITIQNTQVQIFNNEEFGQVRSLMIDGEPWFVGKDVAEALGYSDPRSTVSKKVDQDDRGVAEMETPSGKQKMTLINESGVYTLIFGSKLESAKRFKHWVTSEVLPSIRKTGSYSMQQKPDSYMIEDRIERAKRWIEEETERVELRQKNAELIEENETLSEENEIMKPKAKFHDTVAISEDCITVEEMAKILASNGIPVGRNRLYAWLREIKVLRKNNLPYQKYVKSGSFKIKEYTYPDKRTGEPRIATQTTITPKGQRVIVKAWTDYMEEQEKYMKEKEQGK